MGKKRIVKKSGAEGEGTPKGGRRAVKKRVDTGVLYIQATFNNTKLLFTDPKGSALSWSSAGALGFKGAKKGTPFAAAKVGEVIGEQARNMGAKDVLAVVKGVGAGRESAIRAFVNQGVLLKEIKDVTPVPHNGPRPPKPRRV